MHASLLALALIPALLPAQSGSSARERVAGRVRGADGAPWAGAEVTLWSSASDVLPEIGRADRVTAKTNANGRFRANVLAHRRYSVWAAKAGTLTRVVEAGARETISLVEQDEQPLRLSLEVHGLANWTDARVLAVDVVGRRHEIVLDGGGTAELPAMPGTAATLEVWVADGTRVCSQNVYLTRSRREARRRSRMRGKELAGAIAPGLPDLRRQPMPALEVQRLLVPPPLVVPVRVVDAANQKPIAGTRVLFASPASDVFRPSVLTKPDGTAEIAVPRPIDDWGRPRASPHLVFHALADGFASGQGGWSSWAGNGNKTLGSGKIVDGRTPPVKIELHGGVPFRGRLVSHKEPGPLPMVCEVPGLVMAPGAIGVMEGFSTRLAIRTTADGSFAVPGVKANVAGLALALMLPDKVLDAVLGNRPPLPTNRGIRLPVEIPVANRKHELDLDTVRVVDIALRFPDGQPAARARAHVLGNSTNARSIDFFSPASPELRADHLGRIRLLSFEPECLLGVASDTHYLLEPVELKPNAPDSPLVLTLKPYATVRGRVVDGKGNPIVGVNVGVGTESVRGMGDLVRPIGFLNSRTLRATTDEQGRFELRFIPCAQRSYKIRARTRVGGRNVYGKDQVDIGHESVDGVTIVADW